LYIYLRGRSPLSGSFVPKYAADEHFGCFLGAIEATIFINFLDLGRLPASPGQLLGPWAKIRETVSEKGQHRLQIGGHFGALGATISKHFLIKVSSRNTLGIESDLCSIFG